MNTKKERIFHLILGGLVFILYCSNVIHTFFSMGTFSFNPITHIRCIIHYGFPVSEFITLSVIFLLIIMFSVFSDGGVTEKDTLGRKFDMAKQRQVYGDAHFETPEEFKDIALVQSPKNAYGTILGQMDDSGKHVINQNMANKRDNRHIMVVGGSGSGKTYTFSKPYCYQTVKRRESIVLTDPDGGLYEDMAGYFQDHGYVVRRFDLKTIEKTDGWDCLKIVREAKDVQTMAQIFAHAVVSNSVSESGSDSVYAQGAMSLLKACILRVVLGRDYADEQKNIGSVYNMLQNPMGESYLDTMFDPGNLTADEMPCLCAYMTFKQGSPNLRGNIITNLSNYMQLFQSQLLCKVMSTDDIDLTLPGKQPCAYFCIFPDNDSTYTFIISLFFTMFFVQLVNFADRSKGRRLPVPTNFLLDEFPSIGQIPDFDRKIATVRKRAINLVMILQDITQLQHHYKETWVTLMSNCSTFISLGINDAITADMISKRIGETTIEVKTQQHRQDEAISTIMEAFNSYSTGEGKRALLSYDELFKLNRDDCIILAQYHNPIHCRKYPHTLHPDSKLLRPITMDDIPDITDEKARQKLRAKEAAYIKMYNERHPYQIDRDYAKVVEPSIHKTIGDRVRAMVQDSLTKFVEVESAGPTKAEELEAEAVADDYKLWNPDSSDHFVFDEEDFEIIEVAPADGEEPEDGEAAEEAPAAQQQVKGKTAQIMEEMCGSASVLPADSPGVSFAQQTSEYEPPVPPRPMRQGMARPTTQLFNAKRKPPQNVPPIVIPKQKSIGPVNLPPDKR